MNKINPSHLEQDELRVEYESRNIKSIMSVKQSMLNFCFDLKAPGADTLSQRAHETALQNPKREIIKCSTKIVERVI